MFNAFGLLNDDGTVVWSSCMYGDIKDTLKKHYKNKEVIRNLISLGDLKQLGETISCETIPRFENDPFGKEVGTVAFLRDKGISAASEIAIYPDKEFYASVCRCDYEKVYLYMNRCWHSLNYKTMEWNKIK